MGETMTMQEIEANFDSEWVLLEDPDTDEVLDVRRGKLLWHSKDRDEIYRKAMEFRPKHCAIFYVGTVPDEPVIIL